eukprot:TRINITY_DN4794_c0_g1_i5.p1 TRINITY_DN4794_c0_g1~~TRINITY_DN4794_c0_g1_i5.p1  ORF type:complete len:430 (+),score=105.99 TRINITY_DN4794_c0_g1_i5:92-1291(+)
MPVSPAQAEYLDKHRVAEIMEQLVSGLLHERPSDPKSYLAQALCRNKATECGGVSADPWPFCMSGSVWPRGKRAGVRQKTVREAWPATLSTVTWPRECARQKRRQVKADVDALQVWSHGCAPASMFSDIAELGAQTLRTRSAVSPSPRRTRRLLVVDLSDGNPAQAIALKQALPVAQVVCALPEDKVAAARQAADRVCVKGVEWRAVDLSGRIPVDDGDADLVTCTLCLEHMAERMVAAEIGRILRREGSAMVSVWDSWKSVDMWVAFHETMKAAGATSRSTPSPDPCPLSLKSSVTELLQRDSQLQSVSVDQSEFQIAAATPAAVAAALMEPWLHYVQHQQHKLPSGVAAEDALLRHLPAVLSRIGRGSNLPTNTYSTFTASRPEAAGCVSPSAASDF